MTTKKIFGGILVLILATLACSGGKVVPNVQATINAAVQATQAGLGNNSSVETQSPSIPSPASVAPTNEMPTASILDAQSPCGASKWRIIANAKTEQPSTAGLKLVYVQMLIQNNSSLGGSLLINGGKNDAAIATTEGGFTYPGKLVSGGRLFGAVSVTPGVVPPGLTMNGGAWYDSPQIYEPVVWSFEVADTQNDILITFPSVSVICTDSNGQLVYDTTSLTTDVGKDISQPVDIAAQLKDIKSIAKGIDIKGLGRLEFIRATRETGGPSEEGMLILRFSFMNGSSGYKASGRIYNYLLDNDGAVHTHEGTFASSIGEFEAGPGQTNEFEIKYVMAKPAKDFVFVIESIVNIDTSETIPFAQAYKLP
jgi:hypothetical protein